MISPPEHQKGHVAAFPAWDGGSNSPTLVRAVMSLAGHAQATISEGRRKIKKCLSFFVCFSFFLHLFL
jgi:hypothetical protein